MGVICKIIITVFTLLFAPALAAQDAAQEPPVDNIERVTVGMYINDIQAIDMRTHSYGVDFYLWFRWHNPDINPVDNFELMNTFDPEAHVETRIYDDPQPQPDGSLYQIIRHQGLFSSKFPVAKYPFDSQILLVAVEDAEEGAEALQYVADKDGIKLNPEIRLSGYKIGTPRLVIRDKPYATAFGDLAEPDVSAYSRADFIIPITRPALSGIFKAYIPVFLIILCATLALLLDPKHVEARVGLAITALLTLVAMQFTMLSSLPDVAYLTLIDQLYLASYLYILVVISMIVYATRTDEQGDIQGKKGATANIIKTGPSSAVIISGTYLAVIGLITLANLQ